MYVCMYVEGRKQRWKHGNLTEAFLALAYKPLEVSSTCVEHLKRFVVLIYDRTSSDT